MRLKPRDLAKLLKTRSKALSSKVRGSGLKQGNASKARAGGKDAGPSEHQSQVAVIQWWGHYCKTKGLDERLLWATPNAGAGASRGQAGKMKAEGARAGVPDLFLALPRSSGNPRSSDRQIFNGAFFEMKSAKGKTSEAQAGYIDLLRRTGYNVVVCWSADEAIRAITAYVEGVT